MVLVMAKMVVYNDLDSDVRKPDCCLWTTNVQPANMCCLISAFVVVLSGKYSNQTCYMIFQLVPVAEKP